MKQQALFSGFLTLLFVPFQPLAGGVKSRFGFCFLAELPIGHGHDKVVRATTGLFLERLDATFPVARTVESPSERLGTPCIIWLKSDCLPSQLEREFRIAKRFGGRTQEVGDLKLKWRSSEPIRWLSG